MILGVALVTGAAGRVGGAVVGDFERPTSLSKALEGVGRVFLASRDDPRQPEMEGAFVEAAARSGVEGIVKLSANGARPGSPVALMRHQAQIERILGDSGLGYTILRPQLYMQNFLRFGPSIAAEGKFAAPMGDRRFALVDVRDVARVAATAPTEETHAGATYVVSGPEALSYGDAGDIIGTAIGRKVAYEPTEPRTFRDHLVAGRGLPGWRADDFAHIASAYDRDEGESVTDVVGRVGGSEPRAFAEFVEDYTDRFTPDPPNPT